MVDLLNNKIVTRMKTLQALFLVIFILPVPGEFIHAKPVEPVNRMKVDGASYPRREEMDGIAGCSYSDMESTQIFNPTGQDGDADFSAMFALSWDPEYLYVLAETSDYLPEQISFTYWFVKLPQGPESVTFQYSQKLHRQTQQELETILTQLTEWLGAYQSQGQDFPHRFDCQQNCPYYRSLEVVNQKESNWETILAAIEEIPI